MNKFLTFVNSMLQVTITELPINDKPLYVLSIIGKARTGKSTLLNCIISILRNESSNIFLTSNKDEHCTHGIDYYVIEQLDRVLLILDVQGIEYHDSSLDSKMILFVYLISNLIIFNEKNIISNATLTSLQPLSTFISCFEMNKETKPNIIFRIADVDLEFDPQTNLDKTLEKQDDQYQNIRESIIELFSEILCFKTESLDRSEKKLLLDGKYLEFLRNSNGFAELSNIILQKLVSNKEYNLFDFVLTINTLSQMINENKKIDWNKLDLTKQVAKGEILEWINTNIDSSYYLKVCVDGSQTDYDNIVVPLKTYIDRKLLDFDKRFNNTPPKIRNDYKLEIENRFNIVYEDAMKQTIEKSAEFIRNIISSVFNNIFSGRKFTINICNDKYDIHDNGHEKYETLFARFTDTVLRDTNIVKFNPYVNSKNKIMSGLESDLEIIRNNLKDKIKEFEQNIEDINGNLEKTVENFNNKIIKHYLKKHNSQQDSNMRSSWICLKRFATNFTLSFDQIVTLLLNKFSEVLEKVNTYIETDINVLKYINGSIKQYRIKKYCKHRINAVSLTNKQLLVNKYMDTIKSEKHNFEQLRHSIAPVVLKKYSDELPNYGKLENSKIKYPTYNLSFLKPRSDRIEFIKEHMENAFTKLYTKEEIIRGDYLMENRSSDFVNILAKYILLYSENKYPNVASHIEYTIETKLFDHVIDNLVKFGTELLIHSNVVEDFKSYTDSDSDSDSDSNSDTESESESEEEIKPVRTKSRPQLTPLRVATVESDTESDSED